MIRRTTVPAESVIVLDTSMVLWVVAGVLGAALLVTVVLLVARASRRRRVMPRGRTDDGAGYSAGVARVRSRGDGGSAGHGGARRVADRLFGRPVRSIGLDAARGAALVALAAIVWFHSAGGGAEPARRLAEVVGVTDPDQGVADAVARATDATAVAFVLISGVAIALSSGGATPVAGDERLRSRMRFAVRAILLLGVGGVAAFSGAAFAGLVATIAALSLVALAVLGWSARSLFFAAVLWTIVVPAPAAALAAIVERSDTLVAPPLEWALSGAFPPVPLVGVLLAGMAVGRLDPARIGRRWLVVAVASGCAVLAFGAGAVVPDRLGEVARSALSIAPGSMMPLALLGTGAAVLAFVALALIAGRALRWPLVVLSATGSLASTLWIVSLAAVGAVWLLAPSVASQGMAAAVNSLPLPDVGEGLPEPFRATVVAAAVASLMGVLCVGWRLILGDGPVERLVRAIGTASTRVPDASVSSADAVRADEVASPPASEFDAVIRGEQATRAAPAPAAEPAETAPDTRPVRRPTIGPVDPVTAATQWTPGQALGRLPY